ncbi:MAG: hypothetical protein V3W02_06110 [Gammaproteobacteria bacterium]
MNSAEAQIRRLLRFALLLLIPGLSIYQTVDADEEVDAWVTSLPDPLSYSIYERRPDYGNSPFEREVLCALPLEHQGPSGGIPPSVLGALAQEQHTAGSILQAIDEYCGVENLANRLQMADRFASPRPYIQPLIFYDCGEMPGSCEANAPNDLMCYVERTEYLAAWRVAVWNLGETAEYTSHENLSLLQEGGVLPREAGVIEKAAQYLANWQADHLPSIAEANSANCVSYFTETYLAATLATAREREGAQAQQQRQAQAQLQRQAQAEQEARERQSAEAEVQHAEEQRVALFERASIDLPINQSQLTVQQEQEAARAQAETDAREARRIARASTHPYVAIFDCSVNGSPMPFSACLQTDGRIEIHTAEGVQAYTLSDIAASFSHTVDLTQTFSASAQVGTGSQSGRIEISIVNRLSGRPFASTMASGAGDYATIEN